MLAGLLDQHLSEGKDSNRIVRLRCDKEIPFGVAKYALKGIVQSSATDIRWSVRKEER